MSYEIKPVTSVIRPKVTPDPVSARQLEQRLQALKYRPSKGFLKDQRQTRVAADMIVGAAR